MPDRGPTEGPELIQVAGVIDQAEAIRAARPAGVEAHTGLEDGSGRKDRDKVERFLAEARRALASAATRQVDQDRR